MPSDAVQRISLRWLPDPAFEDTTTIALNVGGYFIDLRVTLSDQSIQWSRAGEKIPLKQDPPTFRWTHIIDSLDLTVPDVAHFEKLPNGDDLEIGVTPAPHKNGEPTAYEEVWRDITAKRTPTELSWILQSTDGTTFVGRVGAHYLAIKKTFSGFAARREDRDISQNKDEWKTEFQSAEATALPSAAQAVAAVDVAGQSWAAGHTVDIAGTSFVFKGVSQD
ncbi:protein HRI1 domain-containing protein [Sarocladium implicatum]|nr:protein HRI1 domain-containing protein [Sarocladium implicatum]